MRQKQFEFDECSMLCGAVKSLNENLFKEIFAFQETMKAKRLKEREENQRIISELCGSVKEIAIDVQDSRKLQNIDINKLRARLKNIQERIQSLRTHNELSMKKLKDEELHLKAEVDKFSNAMENYEKPEEIRITPVPSLKSQFDSDMRCEEIVKFENYLTNNGGHFGGWDEEDHLVFVQIRQKYRQKLLFVKAVQNRFPRLTEDSVLKHEKWYAQYLKLREKQRSAIRKWRAEKEQERSKKRFSAVKPTARTAEDDLVERLERKQKLEEWKRRKMEEKKLNEEERQRIRQWKAQKEYERKQLQDLKRAAVEVYKKEKMYKQSAHLMLQELKELKEREEKAAQANMLLKSFRQQDETYIERRRLYTSQKLKNKENEANKWRLIGRRVSTSVERDPDRLLQPTLAWKDRLMSKSAEPISKPILHLRNMPHL
ncbi:coiled-coil domain-containing protein 112-like [Ischnura elegans]|uniref:coiled-coil domain-containing protein 112-like n=1 Tax=Ischnura elegans TaxID=197161 RepID=UPI001ED86A2E|nr:coiled-coil domain-containing protein 112-like [Ischnura elegans]